MKNGPAGKAAKRTGPTKAKNRKPPAGSPASRIQQVAFGKGRFTLREIRQAVKAQIRGRAADHA
jgi:hypothetical protein